MHVIHLRPRRRPVQVVLAYRPPLPRRSHCGGLHNLQLSQAARVMPAAREVVWHYLKAMIAIAHVVRAESATAAVQRVPHPALRPRGGLSSRRGIQEVV